MRTVPETTVSSLDVYRLYNLLDALPVGSFAGKERLLEELSRARLLAPADMPPTVVTMNSTVKYSIKPSRKVIEVGWRLPHNQCQGSYLPTRKSR